MLITRVFAENGDLLNNLNDPSGFMGGFSNIFLFGLGIGAIAALGTLIYAGITYSVSGDNSSKQKEAREWIWAAVKGLVLLAAGFTIIAITNPGMLTIVKAPFDLLESPYTGPMSVESAFIDAVDPVTGEPIFDGEMVQVGEKEIVITKLSSGMSAPILVEDLKARVEEQEIQGVESIKDESTPDATRVVITVKDGVSPKKVAVQLLSPQSNAAAAETVAYPGTLIRRGSKGEDVKKIQGKLGGLEVDGIFGPLTETAVKKFQKDKGLEVDGIVGPITWAALFGGKSPDDAGEPQNPQPPQGSGKFIYTASVPQLYQGSGPWGSKKFDGTLKCEAQHTYANRGCGATSLAMVVLYHTGNKYMTTKNAVQTIGSKIVARGYKKCVGGKTPSGVYSSAFTAKGIPSSYGLTSYTVSNQAQAKKCFQEGGVMIGSMAKNNLSRFSKSDKTWHPIFTNYAHYIVVKGMNEEKNLFIINDPGGRNAVKSSEIAHYFAYDKATWCIKKK